jgi:hypothetical protein
LALPLDRVLALRFFATHSDALGELRTTYFEKSVELFAASETPYVSICRALSHKSIQSVKRYNAYTSNYYIAWGQGVARYVNDLANFRATALQRLNHNQVNIGS